MATHFAITLHSYCLPLVTPWQSAHESRSERRGWLIQLAIETRCGYGDCAPLPAAGTESPPAAFARLRWWQTQLKMLPPLELTNWLTTALAQCAAAWPSPTPAADTAIETALLDVLAQVNRQPLRQLLHPHAVNTIPVNTTLGPISANTAAQINASAATGYRVFKLKLGMTAVADELNWLLTAATALPPGGQLRLDANQAWDMATAQFVIRYLQDHAVPVESLEEPLATPTAIELAALQAHCSFALALDESLAAWRGQYTPALLPVRRIVLKPSAWGGLRATVRAAHAAQAAGYEVVLTSVIESAVGVWATVQTAAAVLANTPMPERLAQGVATSAWLAMDVGAPPPIDNGLITLSTTTAGNGIVPAVALTGVDIVGGSANDLEITPFIADRRPSE